MTVGFMTDEQQLASQDGRCFIEFVSVDVTRYFSYQTNLFTR
jgi:hypothetical protein